MEETEQKIYTDKDIWKKAASMNKAKYLALMGSTTSKTLWIMALCGVIVVLALMFLIPMPDPEIVCASQANDRVALIAGNTLYLADKTTGKVARAEVNVNAISVAAGEKNIVVTNRAENKLMFFDWQGNKTTEMDVEIPTTCGYGKDWVYCYANGKILIFENMKQINTMSAPNASIAKSIFEHEAVWVLDYSRFWKSSPGGWLPVIEPEPNEKEIKCGWVNQDIKTLTGVKVSVYDLEGKLKEVVDLPEWCPKTNTWLCEDLISISGSKILIGSLKDSEPKILEIK